MLTDAEGVPLVLQTVPANQHDVERTISWLHQFRRLRTRWDRRPKIHQAFLSLASSVICYRIWINER